MLMHRIKCIIKGARSWQRAYYAGMYIAAHVGTNHEPLIVFITYTTIVLHMRYLKYKCSTSVVNNYALSLPPKNWSATTPRNFLAS